MCVATIGDSNGGVRFEKRIWICTPDVESFIAVSCRLLNVGRFMPVMDRISAEDPREAGHPPRFILDTLDVPRVDEEVFADVEGTKI